MDQPVSVQVQLPEVCLPDSAFTPVPPATSCTPPPAGSTANCSVTAVSCTEVSRTNSVTVPGLQDVRFLVVFSLNVGIISPAGVTVCQTSQTSEFYQIVTLSAPPGVATFCETVFGCGPCIAIDDVVCCPLEACLTVFTFVLPCPAP